MDTELDTTGNLIRTILYHIKSIEHRITYYKAINNFKQNDKHKINNAINKVKLAINEIISIVNDKEIIDLIKKNLESTDIIYSSLLLEQMYSLSSDDLGEITDLIDEYLHKKYNIPLEKLEEPIKFARKCDICGCGMNEGYVINGGDEYYCSDDHLHKKYTLEEWKEMYSNNEDSYWTEWKDESDYQYILINNKLREIE